MDEGCQDSYVVFHRHGICQCRVASESLEVSDMAVVFTSRLKVTVSEPFLAELQYTEYTEHRIHRTT